MGEEGERGWGGGGYSCVVISWGWLQSEMGRAGRRVILWWFGIQ